MTWTNNITEKLKVAYPIIQAPMLGVSTPEMAAAISNVGGLGSLAVGGLSPEATQQLIRKTQSLTSKPFAVNLFAHDVAAYAEDDIEPMRQLLLGLAKKRGYNLQAADLTDFRHYTYHEQLAVLIDENIPIVSFTFGCLDTESISRLKRNGCILMGTATCVEEALILEERAIDLIIAQGIEAGGHRGTFINKIPLPQVGLFSLLPQVASAVQTPVIAAGGIYNAQTIKAAFDLGAKAVQPGTAFIRTLESDAIPAYRQQLENATATDTVLTKAFSGRWARGFRNELMNEIEQSGIPIPPYPVQNSMIAKLRKLAQQNNDSQYTTLWAGQSANATPVTSAAEVLTGLVQQYEALYGSAAANKRAIHYGLLKKF